jgi:hypothetical protein
MRSAWPLAGVRQASTMSPQRFSIKAWPRAGQLYHHARAP